MPGGRPNKPTSLKLLEGAANNGPIDIGAESDTDVGPPPKGMKGLARRHWLEQAKVWGTILTDQDRAAFATYCYTWARNVQLEAEVEKVGMFADGGLTPEYKELKEVVASLWRQWGVLGVLPTTRPKVRTGKVVTQGEARKGGLELLTA